MKGPWWSISSIISNRSFSHSLRHELGVTTVADGTVVLPDTVVLLLLLLVMDAFRKSSSCCWCLIMHNLSRNFSSSSTRWKRSASGSWQEMLFVSSAGRSLESSIFFAFGRERSWFGYSVVLYYRNLLLCVSIGFMSTLDASHYFHMYKKRSLLLLAGKGSSSSSAGHFAFFSPENHEKKMPLNVFQIGDEPLKYGFRATSTTTWESHVTFNFSKEKEECIYVVKLHGWLHDCGTDLFPALWSHASHFY